jgi:hypothetical protein
MLENWFSQMNTYILSHPHWIAKLDFLLRVKCGLLMALMGYFVYLIYKERTKPAEKPRKPPYHFVA